MLDELLGWWQDLTPAAQAAIQQSGVLLTALAAGHFLAVMVSRSLRERNFDGAINLPGAATAPVSPLAPAPTPEHSLTPTFLIGWLVRLSVWAAGACWFAHQHGRPDVAERLGLVFGRAWTLACILVVALGVGGLLTRRLIDWLDGPRGDAVGGRGAGRVGGAVAAAVYLLVFLLVVLSAADLFDWPLTRSSAQGLWQLAHNLLMAGAALLVGLVGARWARDTVSVEATTPEKRAGPYTALALIAGATVLAAGVLLSSTGLLIGLVALALLAFLAYLARGYIPDVIAGLQLRAHQVREVWFEGVAWQLHDVGFLASHVSRNGEVCRVQNRVVLEGALLGTPARRPPTRTASQG
ncbi:MAG: hypothetical protein U0793_15105 [Gemmataceae bacterium]